MTAVLLYAISSFSSKSSCRKLRVDSDRAKCRAPTRFEQPFKGQLSASLPQGDSVLAAAAEKQLALQKKKHRPTFRKKTSAKLCACCCCCCTLLYWTDGCAGRMVGRRLPLCLLQQMTPLHVAACTAARAAHAAATASLCFLAASSTSPPPPRRSCGPSTTGRLSPWALGHNRNIEADMSSLERHHLWFYVIFSTPDKLI